jgi:hypothetical protein
MTTGVFAVTWLMMVCRGPSPMTLSPAIFQFSAAVIL